MKQLKIAGAVLGLVFAMGPSAFAQAPSFTINCDQRVVVNLGTQQAPNRVAIPLAGVPCIVGVIYHDAQGGQHDEYSNKCISAANGQCSMSENRPLPTNLTEVGVRTKLDIPQLLENLQTQFGADCIASSESTSDGDITPQGGVANIIREFLCEF